MAFCVTQLQRTRWVFRVREHLAAVEKKKNRGKQIAHIIEHNHKLATECVFHKVMIKLFCSVSKIT